MDSDRYVQAASEALSRGLAQKALEIASLGLNRGSSQFAELRRLMARSYRKREDWAGAEREARRALEHGNDADVNALLAECLHRRDQWSEASKHVDVALEKSPSQVGWWILAATIRSAEGRHEDASAAIERADEFEPGSLDVLVAKAHVYKHAGRDDEVLSDLEGARNANANNVGIAIALGYAFAALGQSEEAVAVLKATLAMAPERDDIKYTLGTCLLRLGRFEEGWPLHEYRQAKAGEGLRLGVPPWRGEDLTDKHLLIWSEQGYGDTIQFAGYLAQVRERAKRVTTLAPPRLVQLLRSNPGLGEILPRDLPPPEADYQALVMSLPYRLGGNRDSKPLDAPFVFPERKRVASWRERLPGGPKVCIAWQGNPNYPLDASRSMPVKRLVPLLERFQGVQFISLQKNAGREQLKRLPQDLRPLDIDEKLDNESDAFLDSIAVLALSEALITTDTALAHLAGAAGVRTYLLLAHVADWRWGIEQARSCWYPSVRLIRQPKRGDWSSAVEECSVLLGQQLDPGWTAALEGEGPAARHSKSKSLAT